MEAVYCGIAADRRAVRAVLNREQLEEELRALRAQGLDEVVLLPVSACRRRIPLTYAMPSRMPPPL